MKVKVVFLVLLFFMGFSFLQCVDCDCPDVVEQYFDIQGLMVSQRSKGGILVEGDEVKFVNYRGIKLEYDIDYIVYQPPTQTPWHWSLMNTAMACSCSEPGAKGSKMEKLQRVTVITLNDFDSEHSANDTINDLILLDALPLDFAVLQDTGRLIHYSSLYLELKKTPDTDPFFKVKVVAELSTGEIYEAESTGVHFIE